MTVIVTNKYLDKVEKEVKNLCPEIMIVLYAREHLGAIKLRRIRFRNLFYNGKQLEIFSDLSGNNSLNRHNIGENETQILEIFEYHEFIFKKDPRITAKNIYDILKAIILHYSPKDD